MRRTFLIVTCLSLATLGAGCASRSVDTKARATQATSLIRLGQPPTVSSAPQQEPVIPPEAKNIPRPR